MESVICRSHVSSIHREQETCPGQFKEISDKEKDDDSIKVV